MIFDEENKKMKNLSIGLPDINNEYNNKSDVNIEK